MILNAKKSAGFQKEFDVPLVASGMVEGFSHIDVTL